MQVHLPRHLAAWLVAVSSFGTLASHASAESISINFGSGKASISAGNSVGLDPVIGSSWNQFGQNSQSTGQSLKDDSEQNSGASVTWSSKEIWEAGGSGTGTEQLMKGYLDDGQGVSITVSGLDYLTYGVYIYCNTDTANAAFSSKTVNGVSYTWADGQTTVGSSSWGASGTSNSLIEGTNTLYIDGQTSSTLNISSNRPANTTNRGCISGIQIVNTYEGTKITASLEGASSSAWTDSLLGTTSWTDSSAQAGTYAEINITSGSADLSIGNGETRHTDAILLSGGNLTISGGTLNLSGPGILRISAGSTLTLSTTVSGKLSLDGAGSVIMNGTNTLTGLSGAGSLTLNGSSSITFTGNDTSYYTGNLTLGDNASINTGNANWTFNGALTMAAANYNANTSWAQGASSLTLTGAGDVEYTLKSGALIPITHADSTLTVRKTTTGTASIGANHLSDIAHLIIEAGRLELTAGDSAYTFESILIGENATLSLSTIGIVFSNTPDMIMKSGSTFEFLNCRAYGASTPVNANITIDAAGSSVTFAGSKWGNGTNIGGTITGVGELILADSSGGSNGYTVSSVISDKDANNKLSVKINKPGGNPVIMSGNNTYSGGTTINSGIVQTNSATALGQGIVLINGGTLNANNQALNNAITLKAGTLQSFGTSGTPRDITVSLTSNATIHNSAVILNNSGQTTMISTGQVLNLTGSTTATLNNAVMNLSSFNTSLINMQNTSVLSLSGGLTLNLSDTLTFDSISQTIDLITLGAGTTLTQPDDWNSMLTLTQNGQKLVWDDVTYNNGSLTFTGLAIPEPGTATLSLLGLTALLLRRKRRS